MSAPSTNVDDVSKSQETPVSPTAKDASLASAFSVASNGDGDAADASSTTTDAPLREFPNSPDGYQLLAELGRGLLERVYRARIVDGPVLVESESTRVGSPFSPLVSPTAASESGRAEVDTQSSDANDDVKGSTTNNKLVRRENEVTVKTINLDMLEIDFVESSVVNEVRNMKALRHRNVANVHATFVHGSSLWIVMPLYFGGSCRKIMASVSPAGFSDECIIATILRDALLGLEYLHSKNHVHRDVKAGNILVTSAGVAKISDFAVAKVLDDIEKGKAGPSTLVGTPCWMAPEAIAMAGYTPKADIWSLGITALELAFGRPPYFDSPRLKIMMSLLDNDPPSAEYYTDRPDRKVSKEFSKFVKKCLRKKPDKRPTATKLLESSFLKKYAKDSSFLFEMLVRRLPATHLQGTEIKQESFERIPTMGAWDFGEADTPLTNTIASFRATVLDKRSSGGIASGGGVKFPSSKVNVTSSASTATASSAAAALRKASRFVDDGDASDDTPSPKPCLLVEDKSDPGFLGSDESPHGQPQPSDSAPPAMVSSSGQAQNKAAIAVTPMPAPAVQSVQQTTAPPSVVSAPAAVPAIVSSPPAVTTASPPAPASTVSEPIPHHVPQAAVSSGAGTALASPPVTAPAPGTTQPVAMSAAAAAVTPAAVAAAPASSHPVSAPAPAQVTQAVPTQPNSVAAPHTTSLPPTAVSAPAAAPQTDFYTTSSPSSQVPVEQKVGATPGVAGAQGLAPLGAPTAATTVQPVKPATGLAPISEAPPAAVAPAQVAPTKSAAAMAASMTAAELEQQLAERVKQVEMLQRALAEQQQQNNSQDNPPSMQAPTSMGRMTPAAIETQIVQPNLMRVASPLEQPALAGQTEVSVATGGVAGFASMKAPIVRNESTRSVTTAASSSDKAAPVSISTASALPLGGTLSMGPPPGAAAGANSPVEPNSVTSSASGVEKRRGRFLVEDDEPATQQ